MVVPDDKHSRFRFRQFLMRLGQNILTVSGLPDIFVNTGADFFRGKFQYKEVNCISQSRTRSWMYRRGSSASGEIKMAKIRLFSRQLIVRLEELCIMPLKYGRDLNTRMTEYSLWYCLLCLKCCELTSVCIALLLSSNLFFILSSASSTIIEKASKRNHSRKPL